MEAPPKTLVKTMRDQARLAQNPDAAGGAPSYLQSFPRGAPGSLPVLEAFHQFLEKERRRAQRRAAGLAAFFVCLILILIGAGAGAGWFFFRQMKIEVTGVQQNLSTFQARAQEVRTHAEKALAGVSAQRVQIAADLEAARQSASGAKTATDAALQKQDAAIVRMQEALALIERQEKAMREELAAWKTQLEAQQKQQMETQVAAAMKSIRPEPAPAPVATATQPTPEILSETVFPPAAQPAVSTSKPAPAIVEPGVEIVAVKPVVSVPPNDPSHSTLDLAVPPGQGSRAVAWRIPILE